jgi:4-aminobutyrate aminotransferase-like enzyme
MMSGNEDQKKWIGYKDKNIHHLPFPYPWDISDSESEKYLESSLSKLKKKIDLKKDICGVMIETFQGWGALFYPKKYIKKLNEICKKNDILITFDEMQAGFSRTGKNFGFQHYDITPDLICCGKGMGGGVPLSGVIGRADLLDLPEIGNMSSTNSANPISCSAGLAVIEEIQKKNLTKETKIKGKILHRELKKISTLRKNLFKVYGKGLIAAMIFEKNIPNLEQKIKYFVERCIEDGLLLVYTGRESIKLGPPLTISKNAIKTAINIIKKNILSVFND